MEFSDKDIRRARQIVQVLKSKAFNDKAIASSKFGRHSILTGDTQFQARERGFILGRGDINTTKSVDKNRLIAQLYRADRRKSAISSSFIGPPEPLTKGKIYGSGTNLPVIYNPTFAALQRASYYKGRNIGAGRKDYIRPRIAIGFSSANAGLPASNIVPYDIGRAQASAWGRSAGNVFGERTDVNPLFADTNWIYNEAPAADPWSAETFALVPKEQADKERAKRIRENESRDKIRNAKRQSDLDALKRRRKEQEQREEEAYQARRFKRRERREAYERFPWLKSMAKSNPIIAKNLPPIAKSLKELSNIPFIGGFINHPLAIATGIGLGLASTIVKESDKANKTTTDWKNAVNLFGNAPKEFEDVARAAGYKDIGEIAKLYGHMTMRFGDPMMALRSLGPNMKNAHPLARMMFASDHGLDEKSMMMFDIVAGKPGLNTKDRLVNQELHKLENLQTKGFSSDANWLERMTAIYLSIPFNKSRLARTIVRANRYVAKDDELLPKFDSLESAVNSQDAYQREYGTGASNEPRGGKTITVNVNTGDVVLPNAQNGNDVINGLMDYSADKSDYEAILNVFDSKTE